MNKTYQQSSTVKVGQLMEVLSRPGVHRHGHPFLQLTRTRVPLISRGDRIIRLVTQSEMIDFLLNNKVGRAMVPDQILNRKINDSTYPRLNIFYSSLASMGTFRLITVLDSMTAIGAFKMLNSKALTAVPVVNDDGKLVRELNVTDLKDLIGNVTKLLHEPLKKWIQEKKPVVCVSKEVTIGEVIKILNQKKIHRVYICEKQKPLGIPPLSCKLTLDVGVISIGDVLNYLRKTAPYPEEIPESYRATRQEVKEKKDRERLRSEEEKHVYV